MSACWKWEKQESSMHSWHSWTDRRITDYANKVLYNSINISPLPCWACSIYAVSSFPPWNILGGLLTKCTVSSIRFMNLYIEHVLSVDVNVCKFTDQWILNTVCWRLYSCYPLRQGDIQIFYFDHSLCSLPHGLYIKFWYFTLLSVQPNEVSVRINCLGRILSSTCAWTPCFSLELTFYFVAISSLSVEGVSF